MVVFASSTLHFRGRSGPHSICRGPDRIHSEYRHVAPTTSIGLVTPGVGEPSCRVSLESEHLHDTLPDRLALEGLTDRL